MASRVGKREIKLPKTVKVVVDSKTVTVQGSKGTLVQEIPLNVKVVVQDDVVTTQGLDGSQNTNALVGTINALISNHVQGVAEGFAKSLTLVGVGYKAALKSAKALVLNVGYSHEVVMDVPEGLTVEVPEATKVLIKGADKQAVGEFAARVRKVRPPEPYKGKGIRYADEKIELKETKKK